MTLTVPVSPAAGWLVLIGGGEFSFGETREADELAVSKMPAGNNRIAFIPAASGSAEYATHLGNYFRGIRSDLDVVNVPIYRGRDARRAKNLEALRSAGMIYIGAGVTNRLLAALHGEPAAEVIEESRRSGSVVVAIAAAASCCGSVTRDMEWPEGFMEGLGWVADSVIEAGFEIGRDERMRRLMSVPSVRVGFGIPASAALAIAPDRSGTILGEGEIAVLRKPPSSPAPST